MPRKILDTSVLIREWNLRRSKVKGVVTTDLAERWGTKLKLFYDPAFLVSPVPIEFLAGAHTSDELALFRSFLSPFRSLDEGKIPPDDWEQARRFAERIPKDGKPRQLGDCIIAAIALRLHCDVVSFDKGFPG
ncbi:MAG: PIN domain-containing protein [Zavarzinella sp.]|nr:PIN domain-containing protein [Zavarzinella sp.]